MTEHWISYHLATRVSSPFHARKHLAVVRNVSWGFLPYEADLIVLRKSGFLTEVEIKVSMSDWKADFLKPKHERLPEEIRQFYFCVPARLADRMTSLTLPDHAGVLSMDENGSSKLIRPAQSNKSAKRLSVEDQLKIARLGALKAWRMGESLYDRGSWF